MTHKAFKSLLISSVAISSITLGVSHSAHAQSNDSANSGGIEEIVVVATRREESLQEVPIALSVIGDETIETLKPQSLSDFGGLAPNVNIGEAEATPGGSAIFIRGLGYSEVEKTQNTPVGVMIDGVVLGVNTGQLIDAFDIEQIEISRGPQGIFFGKNTTGGVINVRRTTPTRELGFKGSVAYGSHETVNVKGIFNAPLGNRGGIKLGATYNETDGYTRNIFTDESAGGKEYLGLNAALEYDIADWANIALRYDRMDLEGEGSPLQFGNRLTAGTFGLNALPSYNADTGSPIGLSPREVINDFDERSSLKTDIYSGTITLDTPVGEVVSVTALLDSKDFQSQDFDATCSSAPTCPFPIANPLIPTPNGALHTERPQAYKQFTQELRLAGSALEDRLDYLLGLYYYDHKITARQTTNAFIEQSSLEDNDSLSFFGNLDYQLLDNFTISAGVRTIDESKTFSNGIEADLVLTGLFPPGQGTFPLVAPFSRDGDYNSTITRFAADWQATPDNLLYASRAEGFRSGGFSIRATLAEQIEGQSNCAADNGNAVPNEVLCPNNDFTGYEPEDVTTIEIGSKNTFMDGQLLFNVDYFNTKIEGLQQGFIVVTPGYGPGTSTYINNLTEAEVDGFEFDMIFKPRALEGFTLTGALGIQDGEVTDGILPANRVQGPTGVAGSTGTADFTGTQTGLGRIADYNYNISGTYEFDLGPGTATVNANYNYIDDHALGTGFGQSDIEEGYGLLNAYLGYSFDKYTISLSGKNLTNQDYRHTSLPAVFFQRWGDNSSWLLEFQAEF